MAVSAIQSHVSAATLAHMAAQPGHLKNLPQDQQIKAAAGQFEAILMRQFLSESVSGLMGGDKGGPTGNVYGYLLTDTLASKLTEGGGMGLASVLEQQLTPHSPVHPGAAAPKSKS